MSLMALGMLIWMILAVSIWGTDPKVAFAESYSPPMLSEVRSYRYLPAASTSQVISTSTKRLSVEPFVASEQNVIDSDWDASYQSGGASFLEAPVVKRLIDELNPFAPLAFDSLSDYYDPFGFQMGTGSFGPQDYRLGWSTLNVITVLPASQAFGTIGNMKIVEWNSNAKYSHVILPGVIFNGTFWFNAHWWDGPGGIALPPQVDQISSDLELGFFSDGPWSGQIAFHPQIVASYESKLDKNAFNFDGRAVATYKASPEWSFVGGVAIWDRVSTLVVPHVGVVWTPNSCWEIRALFPKSRVSYFLGNLRNADYWLYGQFEYTGEAWQSKIMDAVASERIQLTDYRLSVGLRCDTGRYASFMEGGYVFDRHAKFAGSTPAFNLGDTGMFTIGLRY